MLRIIAELDDVPMPVIGFQKVGLGASSHFSHMPDRRQGHSKKKMQ
jgi:hypothetical protein